MEKSKLLWCLTIQCMVLISTMHAEITVLENVDCAPYEDHVATDPKNYNFDPYYVKIHRCHGKHYAQNPKNVKCVPKPNGVVKVTYHAMNQQGQIELRTLDNHTACSQECVISQKDCTPYETFRPSTCGCSCDNYTSTTGKQNCEAPFVWQQSSCNCICPLKAETTTCERRKVFSNEECGCVCKAKFYARCAKRQQVVDENECTCVDPAVIVGKSQSGCDGGVNGAMLAVVIIVEAFVIVFCYYFFYVYCYKHNYLRRKNKSDGFYHNGDVPTDVTPHTNGSTYSANEGSRPTDKELIRQEERERARHNGLSDKDRIHIEEEYPNYYPEQEEKLPLAPRPQQNYEPRRGSGDYFYSDIMEVDGPPSSLDNHNLNIPPDYSDAVSDFSTEDGYGSVTQV